MAACCDAGVSFPWVLVDQPVLERLGSRSPESGSLGDCRRLRHESLSVGTFGHCFAGRLCLPRVGCWMLVFGPYPNFSVSSWLLLDHLRKHLSQVCCRHHCGPSIPEQCHAHCRYLILQRSWHSCHSYCSGGKHQRCSRRRWTGRRASDCSLIFRHSLQPQTIRSSLGQRWQILVGHRH